jgi:hypothetical protein
MELNQLTEYSDHEEDVVNIIQDSDEFSQKTDKSKLAHIICYDDFIIALLTDLQQSEVGDEDHIQDVIEE